MNDPITLPRAVVQQARDALIVATTYLHDDADIEFEQSVAAIDALDEALAQPAPTPELPPLPDERAAPQLADVCKELDRLAPVIGGAVVNAYPEHREPVLALLSAGRAALAQRAAPPKLDPVYGDVLPPIGSRVFIRHSRDDDAHACAVTGYYVWPDLGGNKNLSRVFVRMAYEGTDTENARMLCDCYPTADAALAQRSAEPDGTVALIEECRAALAEELAGWDIDPPLAHVKDAHDHCEEWLAALSATLPQQK